MLGRSPTFFVSDCSLNDARQHFPQLKAVHKNIYHVFHEIDRHQGRSYVVMVAKDVDIMRHYNAFTQYCSEEQRRATPQEPGVDRRYLHLYGDWGSNHTAAPLHPPQRRLGARPATCVAAVA